MAKIILCDICNEPMIIAKRFPNGKSKSGSPYTIIRWKCSNEFACDFQKTIFANDYKDVVKIKYTLDEIDDFITDINEIDDN